VLPTNFAQPNMVLEADDRFQAPIPVMSQVQLFLSTVSEEFRSYRDALRGKLQRPNVTVHVQEDFIPTGTETLDKLDLYIKDCDAVVHLLGDRTGAWTTASTLQALKEHYPDLAERLPPLKPSLEIGEPPLSYTQWEAYLAVYHRKVLLIATAAPEAPRDGKFSIDPELQAAQFGHRERLRQLGRYSEITFTNKDQLIADVFRSTVLDLLARAQGVPIAPLRAVLEKLGVAQIAIEQIPERLAAAADELLTLRQELQRLRNGRPELAAIRDQALVLIDAGDLDAARAVLNGGREAARALREEASRIEAEFLADEARIDRLQLAYRDAARKYAEAAALVARFDGEDEWYYLHQQASELSRCGDEFGDNQALKEAIGVYGRALALVSRERAPLDWATIQNNLGNALAVLGERESSTPRLEEAVAAYREALKEWTRERVPLDWATTQNNLGNTLLVLGEHEGGSARPEEAVAAYREALKERSRERVPLQWAMTQNNLGNALFALGQRDTGTARLEEAVAAFREALREQTRERVPLKWASTLTNLGAALSTLGQRDSGTARLEEAVAAFREALKECSRERLPLQWAATQNNLGSALSMLGERESGITRLEEAVAAYYEALKESMRERVPLDWAGTRNNIGNALLALGRRESGTARLEEAIAAYRDALAVFEPAGVTSLHKVQQNLELAERLLRDKRRTSPAGK
jgi:tetratricopeptide (TPR) repeat protein